MKLLRNKHLETVKELTNQISIMIGNSHETRIIWVIQLTTRKEEATGKLTIKDCILNETSEIEIDDIRSWVSKLPNEIIKALELNKLTEKAIEKLAY